VPTGYANLEWEWRKHVGKGTNLNGLW